MVAVDGSVIKNAIDLSQSIASAARAFSIVAVQFQKVIAIYNK